MSEIRVTADELLAGAAMSFDVSIPRAILSPSDDGSSVAADRSEQETTSVCLRPLTIGTYQLIMKAARNDSDLVPLLMIKESLLDPSLSLEQVKKMHLGLVNFLIASIRSISGLTEKKA